MNDCIFCKIIHGDIPAAKIYAKRMTRLTSLFGLLGAAVVVLIIVTPIIKIKSPGPVLLKQERISRNGKKFKAYSIRTMYMDADRRMKQWLENNSDEPLTPATNPRIIGNENGKTGMGYNLRHWGIDDLPKGFNVLIVDEPGGHPGTLGVRMGAI